DARPVDCLRLFKQRRRVVAVVRRFEIRLDYARLYDRIAGRPRQEQTSLHDFFEFRVEGDVQDVVDHSLRSNRERRHAQYAVSGTRPQPTTHQATPSAATLCTVSELMRTRTSSTQMYVSTAMVKHTSAAVP